MTKPVDKLGAKRQKQAREYLKAHGHNTARINVANLDTVADLRALLCELHQVDPDFYRSVAGG